MNLFKFDVSEEDLGVLRLDSFIAFKVETVGRSYAKKRFGDVVEVTVPELEELSVKPKKMDLDIVYEESGFLILNKPAGVVVHPSDSGAHIEDSLVSGLLYYCKDLGGINGVLRPGIVHRLDKDTSGLLIVAKNDEFQRLFSDMFADRKIQKSYYTLLNGILLPKKGGIDSPIGRDVLNRKKMSVVDERIGKNALTYYSVIEYLDKFSFVDVEIKTGRTHQIRVHFSSIGFSVVGDDLYGSEIVNKKCNVECGLNRQFLHAYSLSFVHPKTGKKEHFIAPLPFDLQHTLDILRD